MEGVWDKLDGYTKSDNLESSDDGDEIRGGVTGRNEIPSTSTENSLPPEAADGESSGEDIELVNGRDVHENLLNEMRNNKLHCNNDPRNIQDKVDQITADKRKQKGELSEMHHKAQVISKSARMSPAEVLSSITSSKTDNEDNNQKEEYYQRIQSVHTEESSTKTPEKDLERTSSSSDIDLPKIPMGTTVVLNIGVMKSRASIARQGSMKARRKPTTMNKKNWTPGISELDFREKDETAVHLDNDGESETRVVSQTTGEEQSAERNLHRSGSLTPSESSSEEEKEVTKPHLRSGIALPGLGDALKIQIQRSELKRPTALHLVKTAKDAKENEVAKEDRSEVVPSKPQWMKEVEERKKTARPPRRKHMTLPGRCSELDKALEKRRNLRALEGITTDSDQANQDRETIAKESPKRKSFSGESIDPELNKLFERRRNLKPVERATTDGERALEEQDPMITDSFKPRNFHPDPRQCSELDKVFEKRRNLIPVEGFRTDVEQGRVEEQRAVIQSVRLTSLNLDDQKTSAIVRAKIHDGHARLEPLHIGSASHVKVATTRHEHHFTGEMTADQSRAGQMSVDRVGQVAQFVFDGKGGSRGMIGRIPPTSSQKPTGNPDQDNNNEIGGPVASRYHNEPRKTRVTNHSRSNHEIHTYNSPVIADLSSTEYRSPVRSFTQERTTIVDFHPNNRGPAPPPFSPPKGSTTSVGYLPSEPRSNREIPDENRTLLISPKSSIPDTRSFIEQLSVKPVSNYNQAVPQGMPWSKHRLVSLDNSVERISYASPANGQPERALYSESTNYEDSDSYRTSSQSFHGNQRLPSCVEGNKTLSESRSSSHLPKHQTQSYNLPPINLNKYPPSNVKSPTSKSPETLYSPTVRDPQQRHNESMQSKTFKETYEVSPSPEKLRKITSPVGSPTSYFSRNSNSFVTTENEVFPNRELTNGHNGIKSPVGSYSSTGQSVDLERQKLEHPKPVTVTVKTMSESPMRLQLKENETSGIRGNLLPRVVNGDGPRRNELDSPLKGRSDPQSSDSPALAPALPKWKQDLKEKKRLQRERQKEMQEMSRKIIHEKDSAKPEQAGNDIAEWQKRLKGIRKTWSEHEDSGKTTNENAKDDSKSDQESEDEKEVPAFLKEFKEQKMKKKVKVTVTAKSTPSHQDAERVNLDEDHKSSSKHDLGTYV